MESKAEDIPDTPAGGDVPPPGDPAPKSDDALGAQIDQLLDQMDETVARISESSPEPGEMPGGTAPASDAGAPGGAPAASEPVDEPMPVQESAGAKPEAAPGPDPSMASLDDQLAGLAQNLLKQDIQKREAAEVAAAASGVAVPAPSPPAASPQAPMPGASESGPKPGAQAGTGAAAPAPEVPAVKVAPAGVGVTVEQEPSALLRLAAVLSAPLAGRPASVRQSIGWIALNTLFLGGALWGYLLVARPGAVQEAARRGFDFKEDVLPMPEPEKRGASEAPAEGGGKAAEGEPKAEEPKAEHGGGAENAAKHEAPKKPQKPQPPKRRPKIQEKKKPAEEGHE